MAAFDEDKSYCAYKLQRDTIVKKFFLTHGVSKRWDLMKSSDVKFNIQLLPSHLQDENVKSLKGANLLIILLINRGRIKSNKIYYTKKSKPFLLIPRFFRLNFKKKKTFLLKKLLPVIVYSMPTWSLIQEIRYKCRRLIMSKNTAISIYLR